ncbi:MAG: YSC84-related protein [Acidobacteriota bacterium]
MGKRTLVMAALLLMAAAPAVQPRGRATREERQEKIRAMRDDTLRELYEKRPAAKELIEQSEGYAVFDNFGLKVLVAGATRGKGILMDRKTGVETFMKMAQVGAGLGAGIKDCRVIFVFTSHKALEHFATKGWEFGGEFHLSAAARQEGASRTGAVVVAPGVLVYQFTEAGLAAEITLGGSRYFKDKELNAGPEAEPPAAAPREPAPAG